MLDNKTHNNQTPDNKFCRNNNNYIKITALRHEWPEKKGFAINRKNGMKEYTFLHFLTPVKLKLNQKLYDVKPGGIVFYSPFTPQYFKAEVPLLHNWMHIENNNDDFKNLLSYYNIEENKIYYPKFDGLITNKIRSLELEWFSSKPFKNESLCAELNSFLIFLSRAITNNVELPQNLKDAEIYKEIRNTLVQEYSSNWDINKLALMAHTSASNFHLVYKKTFGISPIKDLILIRTDAAKNILINTDDKITFVAEKVGYQNEFHFVRQFKKITGVTPGEYRKRYK